MVIGNNSGYELQLASVGFQLRGYDRKFVTSDEQADTVPTNDYHIVRSTLEKEQLWGLRAIFLTSLEAVSLFGTGITPYFHNAGRKGNFALGVNLLGDPIVKGISAVFPDTTIQQLNRLDNLGMHDSAIVPNNTQTRTVVFVPRETLNAYFQTKQEKTNETPALPCANATTTGALDKKPIRHFCDSDDPQSAKYWLGRLIIVGDQIEHRARIHLATGENQGQETPLSISPATLVAEDLTGKGTKITLAGDDMTTLPTRVAGLEQGLELDLDPPGTDSKSRTGILKTTQTTPPPPGDAVLNIPYQAKTATLTIKILHRHVCAVTLAVRAADILGNPAGSEVPLNAEDCPSIQAQSVTGTPTAGNLRFTFAACKSNPASACVTIALQKSGDHNVTFDPGTLVDFTLPNGDPARLSNVDKSPLKVTQPAQ